MSVTTSSIYPDNFKKVFNTPDDKKLKDKDKLYQKRLKQNPDLKNLISTEENTMQTVIKFSSDSETALGIQYNSLYSYNSKTWNSWVFSDIKYDEEKPYFTISYTGDDNRIEKGYLDGVLVTGVMMTKSMKEERIESTSSDDVNVMVESLSKGLEVDDIVNGYLGIKEVKKQ